MTSTIETEDVVRRLRTYAAEWHNAEVCAEAVDSIERLREENALLLDVEKAARELPRATPAPGGGGTEHQFTIEAGAVWSNDIALKRLDKFRAALNQQ